MGSEMCIRDRFLTKDELMEMLDLVGSLSYRVGSSGVVGTYKALIATLGICGLRIGEAAAMKPSDIILDEPSGVRSFRVRRTLSEVNGKLIEGEPKTARARRDVPIPVPVWNLIEEHMDSTGRAAREMGVERGRVFVTPRGAPVRSRNVRRDVLARVNGEMGKGGLRVHDLRHTAISFWIAAGYDPTTVAALAGHSSVSTVFDRYGHLWPNRAIELINKMDLPDKL